MKIISLHIRNLNSLVGDWSIDFTDPAYSEAGFFAITGPTGAGKSTILDAICLALYGKIPRLGRISQTANAIMSTSAGDCSAEVVFSTEKGVFRSTWRQKRAYNKPDRDLQTPVRELSHADSRELIETRSKDIGSLIEEYTGMDYDRFTRTMMLAQGSFTAFLLAPVKERSNILEEITGTEIYSELSKMVFERSRLEETKLSDLRKEAQTMKCLSPGEIEAIQEEITGLAREIDETDRDLKTLQSHIQWLNTVESLTQEVIRLEEALYRSRKKYDEFEEERKRLLSVGRARLIESRYTLLGSHRKEKDDLTLQVEKEKERLPSLREEYYQAVGKEEESRKNLAEAKRIREEDAMIARDVRGLIPLIHAREGECTDTNRLIDDQERDIRSITGEIERLEKDYQDKTEVLRKADEYLSDHRGDEGLSTDVALVSGRYADYQRLLDQSGVHDRLLSELEGKEKTVSKSMNQYQEEIRSLDVVVADLTGQVKILDAGIEELLEGRSPEYLNNSITTLTLRIRDLMDLKRVICSLHEKKGQYNSKKDLIYQNSLSITRVETDLSPYRERESILAEEISGLEKRMHFAEQVLSAEDIRKGLEDDEPCPVCGSVHHPYAEGNIPETGPLKSELQTRRSELTGIRDEISRLTTLIITLSSQNAVLEKENDERAAGIEEDRTTVHRSASALSFIRPDMICEDEVHDAFLSSDSEREKKISIQRDLQSRMAEREKVLKARDEDLKTLDSLKERLQAVQQEYIAIKRDLENCGKNRDTLSEGLKEKKEELQTVFSRYGYPDDRSPGTIITALKKRMKAYEEYHLSRITVAPLISGLESDIRNKKERRDKAVQDHRVLQEKEAQLSEELQVLTGRRHDFYGEKDPDREEERLKGIESDRERVLQDCSRRREETGQALKDLESRILHGTERMQAVSERIRDATRDFHLSLSEQGFQSEEEFVSALLPAAIVSQLEETGKYLNDDLISSHTKAGEKKEELLRQKELNLTSETMEALNGRIILKRQAVQDLQNRLFGKRQVIIDNREQEEAAGRLSKSIAIQTKEQVRWGRLNKLIGSSDGTKFRSYAQGLTLSVLLNYANLHLQKLTDRYFLTTTKESPLEIHVIDKYRAGEVRTAQNLSGGESFIVSLALALGLSAMSSRNVRVDSLFLDEGFGTLDEDSLDTALSTLANMKQDGKLIGVISHVQSLKERIPVQIEVEKKSGGRSILQGPGCRGW